MPLVEELLVGLLDSLPTEAGSPEDGVRLEVHQVELSTPVESHIDHGGALRASLPRGRYSTGFQIPHGRISARFERGEE